MSIKIRLLAKKRDRPRKRILFASYEVCSLKLDYHNLFSDIPLKLVKI